MFNYFDLECELLKRAELLDKGTLDQSHRILELENTGIELAVMLKQSGAGENIIQLMDIYVPEELRGRGIGKKIICKLQEISKATRMPLSVFIDNNNVRLRKFIGLFGFKFGETLDQSTAEGFWSPDQESASTLLYKPSETKIHISNDL